MVDGQMVNGKMVDGQMVNGKMVNFLVLWLIIHLFAVPLCPQ